MIWSERTIGAALQRTVFNRAVCVVDNCIWTGFEADMMIVEPKLRIIDVEIKISRADLKADFYKDKWIEYLPESFGTPRELRPRKLWPREVWKHYYAVPRDVWTDELLPCLGSPNSGVLLLSEGKDGRVSIRCHKRTVPNRAAKKLGAAEVLDIARLASLRLWNAYDAVARAHDDNRRTRAMYEGSTSTSTVKPDAP
jgi:hypothetical protein